MQVNLTYFKQSGKYYSCGHYHTTDSESLLDIWCEVENRRNDGVLPGLVNGHSEFMVLIDVPDHPHNHPHLLV
jgi:hypothetical protein